MAHSILANRNRYDLTHFSYMVGNVGQLQTLSVIPIVAGDSMEIHLSAVCRMAAYRRNLVLDPQLEFFAFYVPHRHVYGSNWTDFITAGQDEGVTFATRTLTGSSQIFGTHTAAGATVPLWLTQGYINIFNRYFKHPSVADTAASYFDALADMHTETQYGMRIGFLKRIWNAAVDAVVTAADYRFALVDTDKIDLLSMASTKGLLKSERRREFFASRYNEIIYAQWGASVNTDADQRPELVMHATGFVGGQDIMGTDDATLGKYTGVAKSLNGMHIPRKFFPEGGALWLMCAVRYPSVHTLEIGYLFGKSQPTYADIAGDPEVISRRAPLTLNLSEYLLGSALTDAGIVPFAQWYREQHNRVHVKYREIEGFPFVEGLFSTAADLKYIPISEYANVFQNEAELAQWQLNARIQVSADRVIPQISQSIFAGTT